MQVSHLRNRSCYLWCSQPPGASLFPSVVCSCHLSHLIVFKSWTGSASLCCIHSPHVPWPLKSPGYGASPLEYGASEVRSLAYMPTSDLDQTHHWATSSTSPTNPLLVWAPFWQPKTIFLWLTYVKWTVLQSRYISSLASSIDSHWFYLLPLITVSCLNHPCSSSHFIAFKLSFQTFSCTCAFLQQFLSSCS